MAIVWVQIDTNAVKTLTLSNGAFLTNITLPPDYGTHANRIIVRDVAHNTATNIVLVERKAHSDGHLRLSERLRFHILGDFAQRQSVHRCTVYHRKREAPAQQ